MQERKPCSGYALRDRMVSTTCAVDVPVWAAQEMIRSGVHSANSRWALGICSGVVVCLPWTDDLGWEATRFPL